MTQDTIQSATELLDQLRHKRVSSRELTEAAIARIERLDGKLNAVVVRDFDRARNAAATADVARSRGEDALLLGLPITVKESNDVEGLKTTWGFPAFKDYVPGNDGAAIARLRRAGAVILGKTNVPVFLADWQSANPIYGRTNNPWDVTKTPGGSTGGGAAAVASGMAALELGSDLAGSIRVPASFCGIYGLKPSYGIVPLAGMKPPFVPDGAGIPVTALGPLARTPDDIELALSVLAAPDGMECSGYRLELPLPRHEALDQFRVLMLDAHPAAECDAELKDALLGIADSLERQRVKISHTSALLPGLMETLECFGRIIRTATSRGAPAQDPVLSAHDWMDTLDLQHRIRLQWKTLFEAFDVVLAPAFGVAAFDHVDGEGERKLIINGKSTDYSAQGAWSSMAGLGNLPALAAPIGLTKNGLPIGMQIIGPYLEDRTPTHFGRLLEREFGGFRPPPGY